MTKEIGRFLWSRFVSFSPCPAHRRCKIQICTIISVALGLKFHFENISQWLFAFKSNLCTVMKNGRYWKSTRAGLGVELGKKFMKKSSYISIAWFSRTLNSNPTLISSLIEYLWLKGIYYATFMTYTTYKWCLWRSEKFHMLLIARFNSISVCTSDELCNVALHYTATSNRG